MDISVGDLGRGHQRNPPRWASPGGYHGNDVDGQEVAEQEVSETTPTPIPPNTPLSSPINFYFVTRRNCIRLQGTLLCINCELFSKSIGFIPKHTVPLMCCQEVWKHVSSHASACRRAQAWGAIVRGKWKALVPLILQHMPPLMFWPYRLTNLMNVTPIIVQSSCLSLCNVCHLSPCLPLDISW